MGNAECRAAFHFLMEAEDREKYCETMNSAVSAEGHVIMATFAYEAPPTCSGLPVVRYSPEFLALAIGNNFEPVESFKEIHITQWATSNRSSIAALQTEALIYLGYRRILK